MKLEPVRIQSNLSNESGKAASRGDPLVSVVIPSRNRRELLPRAIQSVLNQHFQDFELLVIDDGSTDGTPEYLKSISDPRVKPIFQDHQGVSRARNIGIERSRGSFISFLDSDDEWSPSKLKRQLEALEEHPAYLFVHTNEIWLKNGKMINQKKKHRKRGGWIFKHCLPLCVISPSSALIHKKIFFDIGHFDETYPVCEDYELWLRITAKYPILFIDDALIKKHGGHPGQLSRQIWGMDRFRVKALTERIFSGELTPAQEAEASRELAGKCSILAKGFRKRNKIVEAEFYQSLAAGKKLIPELKVPYFPDLPS